MDCQRLAIVFCGTGEHGLSEVNHIVGVVIVEFDQFGPEVFGQKDSSVTQVNVYVFCDRTCLPDFNSLVTASQEARDSVLLL